MFSLLVIWTALLAIFMEPTGAPGGPHVGIMNLAIWEAVMWRHCHVTYLHDQILNVFLDFTQPFLECNPQLASILAVCAVFHRRIGVVIFTLEIGLAMTVCPMISPLDEMAAIFADIFSRIFMNENFCISIRISLKFVPIDYKSVLVQLMTWWNMQQAITWTNADPVHRRICGIGGDELIVLWVDTRFKYFNITQIF